MNQNLWILILILASLFIKRYRAIGFIFCILGVIYPTGIPAIICWIFIIALCWMGYCDNYDPKGDKNNDNS